MTKAIFFDIDGTLYSDMSLYIRILPYFLKRLPFFLAYNRARKILHRTAPLADFYEYQARLLAEELKIDSAKAKQMIQENVYDGMKPFFKKIKTFKGVHQLFEECKVRTIWNDEQEKWYFSVVDVVSVLTDSANPTDYLKKMRKRDPQLAAFVGTNCPQVAMLTETGKKRQTLAADTEAIFRIIQSIPSPKAEPFKLWMAP